jgi:hypothetical protein
MEEQQGFYELVFEHTALNLLVRRRKKLEIKSNPEYGQSNAYILQNGKNLIPVTSVKSMQKLTDDWKTIHKTIKKTQGVRFKKYNEASLVDYLQAFGDELEK